MQTLETNNELEYDDFDKQELSDSEASSASLHSQCDTKMTFVTPSDMAVTKKRKANKVLTNVMHFVQNMFIKFMSVALTFYTVYSLFSLVAWVSHLGERVPFFQNVLLAKGYASNDPVNSVFELFQYNIPAALFFVLPHSLLRPPTLKKLVGSRFSRLFYCTLSAVSCHVLIYSFRPISSELSPKLFSLPVPKLLHDFLSSTMLIFAFIVMLYDSRTLEILGFNRAYYNKNKTNSSSKNKSSKKSETKAMDSETETEAVEKEVGLKRMDIITWMGYTTWLKAGSVGFILFSGLSILPYDVYSWDIIVRVVAASYLRIRSQGFRIWVGHIESTHHFIWIIRAFIVFVAILSQKLLFHNDNNVDNNNNNNVMSGISFREVGFMLFSGLFVFILMDRLEKINK